MINQPIESSFEEDEQDGSSGFDYGSSSDPSSFASSDGMTSSDITGDSNDVIDMQKGPNKIMAPFAGEKFSKKSIQELIRKLNVNETQNLT